MKAYNRVKNNDEGYILLALAILKNYLKKYPPKTVANSNNKLIKGIVSHFDLTEDKLNKLAKMR